MPTIKDNLIIYDERDWLFGLHQQAGLGYPTLTNGLDSASNADPLRFLGYASPGEDPTDVTNVSEIDGVLRNIVYSETASKGYGVGGTKLHEINSLTGAITNTGGDFPHAVTGQTMSDVIKYNMGGAEYIFYSYYDGTDGDIGRFTSGSSTFTDSYWQTTLSGTALSANTEIPMVVGDDDILYFGQGNELWGIDGPNTTALETVLTLPDEYTIRSFAKWGNDTLVIFASTNSVSSLSEGKATAFFWDYLSLDPYRVLELTGSNCGGAFSYRGTIGCFTSGISADTIGVLTCHLNIYDGIKFKKVHSLNTSQKYPIHGGVQVIGKAIFANAGGKVYSFGSPYDGIDAGINQIASGDGSTSGALTTLASNKMLISSGTTTSGGLNIFNGNYTTGSLQTVFAEPIFGMRQKGKVKRVRVEFAKSASGGRSAAVSLLNREAVSSEIIAATTTITAGSEVIEREYDTSNAPLLEFSGLQAQITWGSGSAATDAPIIRRIIVEFNTINI